MTVYIIPVNCVHFVGNVIIQILSTNAWITDHKQLQLTHMYWMKIKTNDKKLFTLQVLNCHFCDRQTKFSQNRLVSYTFFNQLKLFILAINWGDLEITGLQSRSFFSGRSPLKQIFFYCHYNSHFFYYRH